MRQIWFNEADRTLWNRAIDSWGVDAQTHMVIEELAELIVAVEHWKRGRGGAIKVIEEVADVLVVLGQLLELIRMEQNDSVCLEGLRNEYEFKMTRLKQRLDAWKMQDSTEV